MHIVILTGSGISQESGIPTFRDCGTGLWNNFRIEDVCTHEAIIADRKRVCDFYSTMRQQVADKMPNRAHELLAKLEDNHDVDIITQNVDNLHERAGSTKVLHLHGELNKLRSDIDDTAWVNCDASNTVEGNGWQQDLEARHPDGSLLRPYIVFFNEAVPNIEPAIQLTQQADMFVIIGTSLAVYPAASLVQFVPNGCPIYIVDPGDMPPIHGVHHIRKKATEGVAELLTLLKELK